jgi:hypothetical protein
MAYKIDPEVLARECRGVLDIPLGTGERFSVLIERLQLTGIKATRAHHR